MFSNFINRYFGNVSTSSNPIKRKRGRTCRIEELENREMLSVSMAEFATIRSQYTDLNLSASMADYNVIEILANELTDTKLLSAIAEAGMTTQDDLIVLRTTATQNTLTLNGNPITIDINSSRFGSIAIVSLSDSGSSLRVDTQCISRAFRINSGDVALGGIEIAGQTWSFDVGKAYDGLIAVRGQSVLNTSQVRTMATKAPASQAAALERTNPSMMSDALVWDLSAPGVWDTAAWDSGGAMLAAAPHGAGVYSTSEYMIGNVWVTLVLMESNGAIDLNELNWSSTQINNVKAQVREGLDWWETMFDKYNPNSLILLNFTIDYSWADDPFETSYEPIMRDYKAESLWAGEFLVSQGYTGCYREYQSHLTDLRDFNHERRNAKDMDWAFSIFVVNSRTPSNTKIGNGTLTDGWFAYAWTGGPNVVMTYDNGNWGINDMALVLAHEVGHIFWAWDEYGTAGSYNDRSGYYNTQNTNAAYERPTGAPARVDSIMASGSYQRNAYDKYVSSLASLEMIGWRDSNGNGILDVLDTPLTLTTLTGYWDVSTSSFVYAGRSSVTTLPNQNPSGSKSDITLNTVDMLQYKLDEGDWLEADGQYGTYGGTTNVNAGGWATLIGLSPGEHTIVFRTLCERTGVVSNEQTIRFSTSPSAVLSPTNLRSTDTKHNSITLEWDNVSSVTGYEIQYRHTGAATWSNFSVSGTSRTFSGLTANTTYEFRVRAINSEEKSGWSAIFSETTNPIPPIAPNPVKPKVSKTSTISTVTLTFDTKGNNSNTDYVITCSTILPPGATITVTENKAVIKGLTPNKSYKFSVVAKNADGKSAPAVLVLAKTKKYVAVKSFKATAGLNSVTLNWNPSTVYETVGYIIDVYEGSGTRRTLVKTVSVKDKDSDSKTIDNLKTTTRYLFVINAVADMLGNVKSTDTKTTVSTVKYVPVRLVKVTNKTGTTVTLTWNVSKIKETTDYEIVNVATGASVVFSWEPHPSMSGKIIATIGDLTQSTKHTFIIRAVAMVGDIKFESLNAKISVTTTASPV